MRLTIKNAEAVYVSSALQPGRLNVDITGVQLEDILFQVNIDEAISYYGITELLDTIGEQKIRFYLSDPEG